MTETFDLSNINLKASNGKRLLRGLFYEWALSDKSGVTYTLKDQDHKGYPSLRRLYMEASDPTEYTFATTYLDSWDHWEMLCATEWFAPIVARWRRELELKIKSEALARIIKDAKDPNSKTKFTANKFVVEKGWESKEGPSRGRPSKEEIKKAAHEQVSLQTRLDEDLARLKELN
jgi:hypothetical protein